MLTVNVNIGASLKVLFTSETPLTIFQVWDHIQHSTAISKDNFYILYNGRLTNDFDTLTTGSAIITPRFFGGKGGFGSMLRAIGAQIEKTTNREACRDLSGRRLRDINEEKRLKLWIEKQSKRQEEASERKKRKLKKLCSEPKHEFKDQKYDKERSILTERVADAVEEGFKAAAASSGLKRTSETQPQDVKRKKVTLGFGLDLNSDELDSSDDDSDETQTEKHLANEQNNAVSRKSKANSSEEASANNTSDSKDATTGEKSELIDPSEKPLDSEKISSERSSNSSDNRESKISESNEVSAEEKVDSNEVDKSELTVGN